ncbi:biotin/lipoate--protein ligase family protein, partial [Roseibium hamelinense]
VHLAILLEPEVEQARVQEMIFTLMVASADAIGALGPPELAYTWNWPRDVCANDAKLGSVQFQVLEAAEGGVPDFAVVGLNLRLQPYLGEEPGNAPDRTSLFDEGAVELTADAAIGAICRHFLSWLHRWETDGFKPIHDAWLFRCNGYRKAVVSKGLGKAGTFSGIDETGNLLLTDPDTGSVEMISVSEGLKPGGGFVPARSGAE